RAVLLTQKNKNILSYTRSLIEHNLAKLKAGKKIYDKKRRIGIQNLCPWRNEGGRNQALFRIATKGLVFFAKLNSGPMDPRQAMKETLQLEKLIKKSGYKAGNLNVRLIKPHLITHNLFVSDFYALGEVNHISQMS
ncbi:MAG: hypothetical protein NTY48_06215, partial [Candidatus Diapherotrites archaeon]|nr:hypothetical protein [Candidatus Diapherotrites archaeon]